MAKTIVKHATKDQPDVDFVKIDISSAHQGDNRFHVFLLLSIQLVPTIENSKLEMLR